MFKVFFSLKEPQTYRYLDTVNAAIVHAFSVNGVASTMTTGKEAKPWTFACQGYAKPGGVMSLKGLTIATPDATLAGALEKIQGIDIAAQPKTGDILTLQGARRRVLTLDLHPQQNEICVTFASPFVVGRIPPYDRKDSMYLTDLRNIDLGNSLKKTAERCAGRSLDLEVSVDRLTLTTEGTPRWVSFRKSGPKRIMVPGFKFPITLRGTTKDIAFVLHAGLGAKTRQGFGFPILLF